MNDPLDQDSAQPRYRQISLAVAGGVSFAARWGRIDLTPDGIATILRSRTITLTIYPPGIDDHDRRWMELRAATFGWVGATLALIAAAITFTVQGLPGLVIVAGLMAAAYIAIDKVTDRVNAATRRIRIIARPGRRFHGPFELWNSIAAQLDDLEETHSNPVAYEAEWGRVYRQLDR